MIVSEQRGHINFSYIQSKLVIVNFPFHYVIFSLFFTITRFIKKIHYIERN
ncbi:hypothetical protein RhiirA5_151062 [Rhizophagus irregularis]|uniref:Uncharacterized protein n=1 Tax=Rhizophagus irregularis TaxID=588596 RepID=A0A2N0QBZ0_9GLOM|nr:hypothetical protein RhiirA5_151062 [Rhizophagus irregularis]GET53284.1 hypothetical protein RIR_e57728_A0A2N0QBZ0_9GLOM [Rhizophagus irregularis DAOM 181602=DAOM 197198]